MRGGIALMVTLCTIDGCRWEYEFFELLLPPQNDPLFICILFCNP
jgi:hypothetical protein